MREISRSLLSLFLIVTMVSTFLVVAPPSASAAGTTFYVDSVSGNDGNSGTSTTTAWRTISKVNSITFHAGDKILFKTGGSWTGSLHPLGSGDSTGVITIDKYGTGANPIINGGGNRQAILLYRQHYWTIQNLDVTNPDPTPGSVELRDGVRLVADGSGQVLRNITIRNLNVYNIGGSHQFYGAARMFDNAGIHVEYIPTYPLGRFDNLIIENNYIHDVDTGGIISFAADNSPYIHNISSWSTNVKVRNNTVTNTGSDGILIGIANGPLVEYNTVGNTGINGDSSTVTVAGNWSYNTNNAVFQFNETYGTKVILGDGTAWDTDWGAAGTHIYQYNYSHDNEGGFKIGPATANLNPHLIADVVRYNISQNDGSVLGIRICVNMGVMQIYNNTFYSPNYPINIFTDDATPGNKFYNNIVVANGESSYEPSVEYNSNIYYGNLGPPTDPNRIHLNPQFVNPGTGGSGLNSVNGYKLTNTSPALNNGVVIANNGGRDYYGNALYNGSPDIGAFEFQGIPLSGNINDTTASITYTGTWVYSNGRGYGDHNNDVHATETNGDSVQYTFTGTSVDYITETNSDQGNVDVFIDGVLKQTVSTYSATRRIQQKVYSITGLTAGSHTIKLVKKSGAWMLLDAFRVNVPTGPMVLPVIIDDPALTYSGTWQVNPTRFNYYNITDHYTKTAGAAASYTFNGTNISWYGLKGNDHGKADIYMDGVWDATVDLYQPTRVSQSLLYSKAGLSNGSHTIRIVARNDKNAASSDYFVEVDYLQIKKPAIVDDSAITAYTGTWVTTGFGPNYYNNTDHSTTTAGSRASFSFLGTTVSWYGVKGNDHGKADIYIDGVLDATVDLYQATRSQQVLCYTKSGLSNGMHTIEIVARSDKNSLSTDYYVEVDYIQYQ